MLFIRNGFFTDANEFAHLASKKAIIKKGFACSVKKILIQSKVVFAIRTSISEF